MSETLTLEQAETRDDGPPCPTCDGTGKINAGTTDCPDCGGTGNAHRQPSTEPIASQTLACALCDGAGGGFDEFGEAYDCRVCGGKGTL